MATPTLNLYQSATLESTTNNDLEQALERKLNDVNSFTNSMNNIIERFTYFKDKNHKSKKKHKIKKN